MHISYSSDTVAAVVWELYGARRLHDKIPPPSMRLLKFGRRTPLPPLPTTTTRTTSCNRDNTRKLAVVSHAPTAPQPVDWAEATDSQTSGRFPTPTKPYHSRERQRRRVYDMPTHRNIRACTQTHTNLHVRGVRRRWISCFEYAMVSMITTDRRCPYDCIHDSKRLTGDARQRTMSNNMVL